MISVGRCQQWEPKMKNWYKPDMADESTQPGQNPPEIKQHIKVLFIFMNTKKKIFKIASTHNFRKQKDNYLI